MTLRLASKRLNQRLNVIRLEQRLTSYAEGLCLQEKMATACEHGAEDAVILIQHSPVYTLGKRGVESDFLKKPEDIKALGAEIFNVPRGGETTFHGPGQLVMYPIINLRRLGCGGRAYVEGLEDTMIRCLGTYGIPARGRLRKQTGVWVGEQKIGAVGVRISSGVTTHGLALNVNTDLEYFRCIVPCGLPDKEVVTMQNILRLQLDLSQVADEMLDAFQARFGYREA